MSRGGLRTEKALVSLGLLLLLHPVFSSVARLASARALPAPVWLVTPLDTALPVIPAAVWIYLSWYPATATALLLDRRAFRQAYRAYVLAFGVCVAMHLLFPVTIARPEIMQPAHGSWAALAFLYAIDRPVNLFPSFHAAVAAILIRLRPGRSPLAAAMPYWMAAVCVSCVLTRQHYAADVAAGLALGWAVVRALELRGKTRDDRLLVTGSYGVRAHP